MDMNDQSMSSDKSCTQWDEISGDYEVLKNIGTGAFGSVVKAKHKITHQIVSIKLIKECFINIHRVRMLLRELMILRKLSEMEDNIFTTKLYDVILPQGVICQDSNELSKQATGDSKIVTNEEAEGLEDVTINFKNLTHIFIVMEYVDTDF